MADYKGVIKFIGENADWALVREYSMIEDNVATSTGIGTGDDSNRYFSATLTSIVEEGEIVIKVNGVAVDATDSDGVISGLDISTSTGEESTIDYETGALEIYFTSTGTPGAGEAVTVDYQYSSTPVEFDRHKFIKGDFTGKSVDDVVYYDYDADTSLQDGHYVTETYES
jgi:hypothetical protein